MNAEKLAHAGLIYRVEVGSRVSGINQGGGDIDHIGVCLEPPEYVTGLSSFDQYQYRDAAQRPAEPGKTNRSQEGDLDLTIYSARKFCALAAKGNPSVLETLFAPFTSVVMYTQWGFWLRTHAESFVSKQAGPRYLGYMTSQLSSLTGERKTHTNRPELIEEFGYDCKFAAHALRLGLQGIELMETGEITLPIPEPHLAALRAVRQGKSNLPDVVAWAQDLRMDLAVAIERSKLPENPDMGLINGFLHEAHLEYWSEKF